MSNYPVYQYQPQMGGYGQQMQMYPYQQPMQPMQPMQGMQQEEPMVCRMVTGPEEARGVPVDFSGRPMTFLDLPHGRIFVKAFDKGSGSAVFREFRLAEEPAQEAQTQPAVAWAPMSVVQELSETVARMREELKGLKAARRSRVQEADENDD